MNISKSIIHIHKRRLETTKSDFRRSLKYPFTCCPIIPVVLLEYEKKRGKARGGDALVVLLHLSLWATETYDLLVNLEKVKVQIFFEGGYRKFVH